MKLQGKPYAYVVLIVTYFCSCQRLLTFVRLCVVVVVDSIVFFTSGLNRLILLLTYCSRGSASETDLTEYLYMLYISSV